MKMYRKYSRLKLEIYEFDAEDVIVTSSGAQGGGEDDNDDDFD